MAKTVNIDTPNPELPDDIQAQVAAQNARETKQILMKQGINLVFQKETTTPFQLASSAITTKLEAWEAALATSGGFIEFEFVTTVSYDATNNVQIRITVDGNTTTSYSRTQKTSGNVSDISTIRVKWKGYLVAGNHLFQVFFNSGGGNATFSAGSNTTEMTVTETIL